LTTATASTTTTTTTTTTATVAAAPAERPPTNPTVYYRASEGDTRFVVVFNDDSERNLIWLMALKEIFSKQLPKMPREYIVRLVLDRGHQSLLCLEGDTVVGGVCMRPYLEQRFAEIAFCAVDANHQVKGYGTRIMNQLKEYTKHTGMTHFLTFADNFAIGYFKKQGFSATVTMPKERWTGFIKEYDGGTLMECVVHPRINYLAIPDMIKKQRQFLLDKMNEARAVDVVYPGLEQAMAKAGGKIEDPFTQIPGLAEAGWRMPIISIPSNSSLGAAAAAAAAAATAASSSAPLTGPAGAELQSALRSVWDQVSAHRDAWPFHEVSRCLRPRPQITRARK
jgi:histone acetyltransferase